MRNEVLLFYEEQPDGTEENQRSEFSHCQKCVESVSLLDPKNVNDGEEGKYTDKSRRARYRVNEPWNEAAE